MKDLIKKLVILSLVMIVIALSIVKLYGAYATGTQTSHTFTLTGNANGMASMSEDGEIDLSIKNEKGIELPATGGIGTNIFDNIGTMLIVLSLIMMFVSKKRRA